MNAALVIIGLIALGALALGLAAHRGLRMTLEQWTVAGRGFGGAAGVPVAGRRDLHHLHLPRRQRMGLRPRRADLLHPRLRLAGLCPVLLAAAADLALRQARASASRNRTSSPRNTTAPGWACSSRSVGRRGARSLSGAAVHRASASSSRLASYGSISSTAAIWIGAATVTIYVMISGVHGVAWNAVVKDVLILAGGGVSRHLPPAPSITAASAKCSTPSTPPSRASSTFKPTGQSVLWFQSTVALTALGFFMWPHAFSAAFTAGKSAPSAATRWCCHSISSSCCSSSSAASPRSSRFPA